MGKLTIMKKLSIIFLFAAVTLVSSCGSDNDSVKIAHQTNLNSSIDERISKFMTEAADARMMDIEEGKLAMEKGTNDLVKNYAQKLIDDNTKLLKELRSLAGQKNIALPTTLSNDKADGLNDLREKEGKAFDEKFIKMIQRDHKRDLDDFEDAADFNDRDIQQFAQRNVSLFENHLSQVDQVEESNERISEGNADEVDN
jgi:putative membrane protein